MTTNIDLLEALDSAICKREACIVHKDKEGQVFYERSADAIKAKIYDRMVRGFDG